MNPRLTAVQMYTLRDPAAADFARTLSDVAAIGYRAVELAGFHGVPPHRLRRLLDDLGLTAIASHVPIEALETELDKVIEDHLALGVRALVMPFLAEDRRGSADTWLANARQLANLGRTVAARGLQLVYHHHDFEFESYGGTNGFEIILQNTDPALVKLELDVYWLTFAGQSPAAWIERLGTRVQIVHLKDMMPGPLRRFAPVGSGIIDFPPILAAIARIEAIDGIPRHVVVEQDETYDTPPMDAIRQSFFNLLGNSIALDAGRRSKSGADESLPQMETR